jgi:hypothetical protein
VVDIRQRREWAAKRSGLHWDVASTATMRERGSSPRTHERCPDHGVEALSMPLFNKNLF